MTGLIKTIKIRENELENGKKKSMRRKSMTIRRIIT